MAKVALWYNATSSGLSVAPVTWQRFCDRGFTSESGGSPKAPPDLVRSAARLPGGHSWITLPTSADLLLHPGVIITCEFPRVGYQGSYV